MHNKELLQLTIAYIYFITWSLSLQFVRFKYFRWQLIVRKCCSWRNFSDMNSLPCKFRNSICWFLASVSQILCSVLAFKEFLARWSFWIRQSRRKSHKSSVLLEVILSSFILSSMSSYLRFLIGLPCIKLSMDCFKNIVMISWGSLHSVLISKLGLPCKNHQYHYEIYSMRWHYSEPRLSLYIQRSIHWYQYSGNSKFGAIHYLQEGLQELLHIYNVVHSEREFYCCWYWGDTAYC